MDIYDIISRSLLHRLDEGEQQQLDQWLAEDEEHLRLYQSFLAKKDLVEQYHKYQAFDEEQGWKKLAPLLDKPAKSHLLVPLSRWRVPISRRLLMRMDIIRSRCLPLKAR